MRMTKNEFQEFEKKCAERFWKEPGYGLKQMKEDCDAIEVLPFDLSEYQIEEEVLRWINILFTTEDVNRNGKLMLRGFTMNDAGWYMEMQRLKLTDGDYGNGYSEWGYSKENRLIYTYCEGDTTLTLLKTDEEYEDEYKETYKWYRKERE